mgnify:CR=1 FL=1
MRTYRMSGIPTPDGCIIPLIATYFGYEPIAKSEVDEDKLDYYTRLEAVVADRLEKEGLELIDAGVCQKCLAEFGEERRGLHAEFTVDSVRFVGHLDRYAIIDNEWYPVEIKNLGRFMFDKAKKEGIFNVYPSYAVQEALYLRDSGKPGLYVVNNRDTGEMLKYSIPWEPGYLELKGFERLELPFSINDIFQTVISADNLVDQDN